MTTIENSYINHFRESGCAVLVVTPAQLQGTDPKSVEHAMKAAAQEVVMDEVCAAA